MRNISTLQRVVKELKEKQVTIKDLSSETNMNYNYLTRVISGNTKYSNALYDKIMVIARTLGIDTTTYKTMEIPQEVINTMPTSDGLTAVINLRLRIQNNSITGVEWDMVH
jgi:transcriptional regulator with XRE-family HTH domain